MKKTVLATSYFAVLAIVFSMTSCQDDPITPNDNNGSNVDTTWVDDSTNLNPNNGSGNGLPCDSTNGGGNTNPNDSTNWNPNNGGGNTNPNDTTNWGGNPSDSTGGN
ncbi:MAG: hypothetical protein MK105_10340 [Crocinitomicaceae bacterium]|nr:hypothetical protein [Crocinitomicaceae bacterium]